jgi:hypothetical protein
MGKNRLKTGFTREWGKHPRPGPKFPDHLRFFWISKNTRENPAFRKTIAWWTLGHHHECHAGLVRGRGTQRRKASAMVG